MAACGAGETAVAAAVSPSCPTPQARPFFSGINPVADICAGVQAMLGKSISVQLELNACQLIAAVVVLGLVVATVLCWLLRSLKKSKVYVLDFAVHKPHER